MFLGPNGLPLNSNKRKRHESGSGNIEKQEHIKIHVQCIITKLKMYILYLTNN